MTSRAHAKTSTREPSRDAARVRSFVTKIHTPFPLPLCVWSDQRRRRTSIPSRKTKKTRLKDPLKGCFFCSVLLPNQPAIKILPFNGSHHPRLEESRKKNRSGNPLSGRGIGERRARGVHSLCSHWSVGGAYELDADESESQFVHHTESPLARAFSLFKLNVG